MLQHTHAQTHTHTHACIETWGSRGGPTPILGLNWFQTPIKSQIGNNLSKSILFEQSRVELVKSRERVLFIGTQFSILYTSMYSPAGEEILGQSETTAFNPFLTMPRTQLITETLGTNGRSRAF